MHKKKSQNGSRRAMEYANGRPTTTSEFPELSTTSPRVGSWTATCHREEYNKTEAMMIIVWIDCNFVASTSTSNLYGFLSIVV